MAVEGFKLLKTFHSSFGSAIQNASVSMYIPFFTVGGRISWINNFIRPAVLRVNITAGNLAGVQTYAVLPNGLF